MLTYDSKCIHLDVFLLGNYVCNIVVHYTRYNVYLVIHMTFITYEAWHSHVVAHHIALCTVTSHIMGVSARLKNTAFGD